MDIIFDRDISAFLPDFYDETALCAGTSEPSGNA